MNALYILLAPLAALALYNKTKRVMVAKKEGNTSQLKAELLFLTIIVFIILGLVLMIEVA